MSFTLSSEDESFVQAAYSYFEKPSFFVRASQAVGSPIEHTVNHLPDNIQNAISQACQKALNTALHVSLFTLEAENKPGRIGKAAKFVPSSQKAHRIAATLTGAAGGFFGMPALPIELPITTVLMLRSVAKIAQESGADLEDRQTQLECLYVFSMGKSGLDDPVLDSNYYSARMVFTTMVRDILEVFATRGSKEIAELLAQGSIPVLARLLSQIAARFQLLVADKVIAQSVPILGAIAGGSINFLFTEHFNTTAKFHFGLKKLEKKYGHEALQAAYFESRNRLAKKS